jgi:DNA-binding MarR family transcriptional regulator
LPDAVTEAIVSHFDGTPRHLLRLARRALVTDPDETASRAKQLAEIAGSLSRGAQRLLADMQGRGPVTATEPALLQRLGLTDRQTRRNLSELEAAGLVEEMHSSSSSQGRPPVTYRLTPLGQIDELPP